MVDLIGAIVALLAADPAVAAIADVRVFGGELPPDETAAMPRGAIVVEPSGGTSLLGGSYAEADTQRIDITAYGATPRQAAELMEAAAGVMRRIRRTVSAGVLIHWANSAGGFQAGREPNTEWPRVWRSFQVLHSLKEV